MKAKIKCKNCGSEDISVMVDITAVMPIDMYRHLTKKKMRRKEFELWGANWGDASFICKKCGNTIRLGK